MARGSEKPGKKLSKYFCYRVDDKSCVAHLYLRNGLELSQLQLSPYVDVLENTALVESVLEIYYDYLKMLSSRQG